MNAMTSGAHAGLDKHAPHPVDGHPDYEWYDDALGGERHTVYWVPAVDAILDVGIVRPNPERTTTNQVPALLAEDADGEWIASGATVPALARVLVCCAALKLPMGEALWVPMVWGDQTPPGGAAAGFGR